MEAFNYRDGELFAEGVALSALAQRFGTPTYVYSRAHIEGEMGGREKQEQKRKEATHRPQKMNPAKKK